MRQVTGEIMRTPFWLVPLTAIAGASGAWAMADDIALQPGEWEMTIETVSLSVPNLPPEDLAVLKRPPVTSRSCMSGEDAKGPKPDSFGGKGCKTESFRWSGGKIEGTITCSPPGGKTIMALDGDYGPDSMTMSMKTATETESMTMTMDLRVTGRRIGDCSKGDLNKR
jgi:hypothetical protein